ncbi:hypothetical protein QUB05_14180 [Microcoleus sp. F10-C6]|uniref:hypothetical protein n=1 Tax=unclassified Microcoleus TaxID=2642155 RepID=UPI002FD552A5
MSIAILNDSDKFVGVVPFFAYPLSIGQPQGDCPYNNYVNDLGLLYSKRTSRKEGKEHRFVVMREFLKLGINKKSSYDFKLD